MSAPGPGAPWDARTLAKELVDAGAVRFGSFTLASGASSDVYVDVKRAWTDPRRLEGIARALAARVGPEQCLAGMELGAVPLVVALALQVRRPYVVLRKAPKEHGTRQAFEGEIPRGGTVLLIEDVTTTGGSTARSVEIVRDAGGTIDRAVAVVDRESGATERLAALGVRLEALLTLSELRAGRK
ncbi:MAG TPA: orotate phosphoribosyltransferase [Thermoplasmata archaeon]|nr:orotate phosphoribosyltransferase [Thermoplasmata archaeon]